MKKILFILLLTIGSLVAKPCMTDIYFGNGVWNPDRDKVVADQLFSLKEFMLYRAPTPLNKADQGKLFNWKVAYNYSTGTNTDLIETFYQLKESGQITEGYFTMISATLAAKDGANSNAEILTKIQSIIKYYNYNVSRMYEIYQQSSFNQKHNVLLVAHSQGNLFGNKMYTLMNDKEKKRFRMVSVATPANHVMKPNQTFPYVTAKLDYVIGPIPGSLPGNVDGVGHTFLGTYLDSSIHKKCL